MCTENGGGADPEGAATPASLVLIMTGAAAVSIFSSIGLRMSFEFGLCFVPDRVNVLVLFAPIGI